MIENRFNRRVGNFFITFGLVYLTAGVILLAVFGPVKTEIFGVGFSHTSLTKPAKTVLVLFLLGVYFRLRYRYSLQPEERKRVPIVRWLVLLALIWALFFSAYSLILHHTYRSGALDMAVHSQLLWNLGRGNFLQSSFFGYSFAANHFWIGLYLFLPVFWIGGESALLISEAIILALGVFPAYFLARDILKSRIWAFSLALSYLLHPTLSVGVLFEFHLEPITIPIVVFSLLALKRRRFFLFAVLAALAVSWYEVTALVFALFGLVLIFKKRWRKPGVFLFLTASVYLLIIWKVVMPHFGEENYFPHWVRYSHLGTDPLDAVFQSLTHPLRIVRMSLAEKGDIKNLIYNFQAFGFLPLLAPLVLVPALPLTAALFLSSWSAQIDIRLGYIAPAIPFFFLAAVVGARRIISLGGEVGTWLKRYGMLILLLSAGILFLDFQLERQIRGFPFPLRKNLDQIREAAALIPPQAPLSADWHLGAHFGSRNAILLYPVIKHLDTPAEYVFLDLEEKAVKDENYWRSVAGLLCSRTWGPVYYSSGVLLLKRGEDHDRQRLRPARLRVEERLKEIADYKEKKAKTEK